MVKALDTTHVVVESTKQIVDAIGLRFSQMATLANHPEMQVLLDESWQYIQQLEQISHAKDAILAGAQAAINKLAAQRDDAITQNRVLQRAADEFVKELMARYIAYEGHIPVKNVALALEVISGERETEAEVELEEVIDAIEKLGNRVIEEQLLEAASRKK